MVIAIETPPRGRWQQINTWCGYLIFGFPAVAAIPAMIATVAHFGLLDSILSAGPGAVAACVPLVLWGRYTRRRPGTYTGKLTWSVIAIIALGALTFSPLFFWAGPATLVLLSEVLRLVVGSSLPTIRPLRAARRALDSLTTRSHR